MYVLEITFRGPVKGYSTFLIINLKWHSSWMEKLKYMQTMHECVWIEAVALEGE